MSDDRWKELFEVKEKTTDECGEIVGYYPPRFVLVEKASETTIGEYKDSKYAVRQARHKYKKIIKMMEKKFMT